MELWIGILIGCRFSGWYELNLNYGDGGLIICLMGGLNYGLGFVNGELMVGSIEFVLRSYLKIINGVILGCLIFVSLNFFGWIYGNFW